MKITIDSKTGEVKVNGKLLKDAPEHYKPIAEFSLRSAYQNNFPLTNYEEDCMWMSYRYCIGRHTIASHMHATDIWQNCKGNRMSKERQLFTAFDINREIESNLTFMRPSFHFPLTSLNKIYTPAVDIVCQFMEDYNIKSIEDFIKYKEIYVKLYDNERGYTFETITWEEYLRPKVLDYCKKYYIDQSFTEDSAWKYYCDCRDGEIIPQEEFWEQIKKITRDMPDPEHYYFHDLEDLFIWNDLVHCFDYEHHHKSILTNGEEVEWFWTWEYNSGQREDGYYYRTFGYHKIRVALKDWNGIVTKYIPDECIQEDIY